MQLLSTLLLLSVLVGLCCGHGFLAKPASRNNMRLVVDAKTPTECAYGAGKCTTPQVDYDKQSGAAGGPGVVHEKCHFGAADCLPQYGMCGDKFDGDQNHLEGGKFSSGLLNGIYAPGQTIQMSLIVTAHHKGYHEFILWDVSDDATATTVTTPATPAYRLKQYQPPAANTECEYWNIDPTYNWCMPPPTGPSINAAGYNYTVAFTLPAGVTCKRCVLQWHWVTANSPGANPEEFWNCADISIRSSGPYMNDKLDTSILSVDGGNAPGASSPTGAPQATAPPVPSGATCIAVAGKGIDDGWCRSVNCATDYVIGGFCQYTIKATGGPSSSPSSTSTPATGDCVAMSGKGVSDAWCRSVNCNSAYAGFCTKTATTSPTGNPATSPPKATTLPGTPTSTPVTPTSTPATAPPQATTLPGTPSTPTSTPSTASPKTTTTPTTPTTNPTNPASKPSATILPTAQPNFGQEAALKASSDGFRTHVASVGMVLLCMFVALML